MKKIESLYELNQKAWYRFLKVIFVLILIIVLGGLNLVIWTTKPSNISFDYDTLASQIKEKFPEYKDFDNGFLAQKIIEKYPQFTNKLYIGYIGQPSDIQIEDQKFIIVNWVKDPAIEQWKKDSFLNAIMNGQIKDSDTPDMANQIKQKYGNIYDTFKPTIYSATNNIENFAITLAGGNTSKNPQDPSLTNDKNNGGVLIKDFFAKQDKEYSNKLNELYRNIVIANLITILFFEAVRRTFYYVVLGKFNPSKT